MNKEKKGEGWKSNLQDKKFYFLKECFNNSIKNILMRFMMLESLHFSERHLLLSASPCAYVHWRGVLYQDFLHSLIWFFIILVLFVGLYIGHIGKVINNYVDYCKSTCLLSSIQVNFIQMK